MSVGGWLWFDVFFRWKKRSYKKEDDDGEDDEANAAKLATSAFRTAGHQLAINSMKKGQGRVGYAPKFGSNLGSGIHRAFKNPVIGWNKEEQQAEDPVENEVDERLKNIDPKFVELIQNEIMHNGTPVHWDDIAGLEFVKKTVKEMVVFPMLRPDIFSGLRGPPKGKMAKWWFASKTIISWHSDL